MLCSCERFKPTLAACCKVSHSLGYTFHQYSSLTSLFFTAGDTSWKKGPICEADTRVSLNVIGANKTKIQVAMTEMQAVLNDAQVARQKAKVDSNKHTPVKTQEPVKLSEIEKKEYEQKGARPKQMETLKKCSSITSARKFGITKGSQVKYHTEKGTGHSSYNLVCLWRNFIFILNCDICYQFVAIRRPDWKQCQYMVHTFKIVFYKTKNTLVLNICEYDRGCELFQFCKKLVPSVDSISI